MDIWKWIVEEEHGPNRCYGTLAVDQQRNCAYWRSLNPLTERRKYTAEWADLVITDAIRDKLNNVTPRYELSKLRETA